MRYFNGQWVVYVNPGHDYHLMPFQVYSYREETYCLQYGQRSVFAEVTQVQDIKRINDLLRNEKRRESN